MPVQIAAAGHETAQAEADCELAVQGKVLRRLSVYGPDIDVNGTVMLGRVLKVKRPPSS